MTDAATLAAAAVEKERTLAHDVSGAALDTAVLSLTAGGIPLACTGLAADGASGTPLVSSVNALDVDLAGDVAFNFVLTCE